jgi:hypothetical protein
MRDAGFEPATCRRGDRSERWLQQHEVRGRKEMVRDAGFEPATSCV